MREAWGKGWLEGGEVLAKLTVQAYYYYSIHKMYDYNTYIDLTKTLLSKVVSVGVIIITPLTMHGM